MKARATPSKENGEGNQRWNIIIISFLQLHNCDPNARFRLLNLIEKVRDLFRLVIKSSPLGAGGVRRSVVMIPMGRRQKFVIDHLENFSSSSWGSVTQVVHRGLISESRLSDGFSPNRV
jgi:hypothetical protein